MSDTITIASKGLEDALDGLAQLGADPSPALRDVGTAWLSLVQLGFKVGKSPYGEPWAPLKVRAGQPLRDTRRLQNSFTFVVEGGGSDALLRLGTNTYYAPFHQFGAVIKPVKAKFLRFQIGGAQYAKALNINGKGGSTVYTKGPVVLPARPFLPINALPAAWSGAATKAINRKIAEIVAAAGDAQGAGNAA